MQPHTNRPDRTVIAARPRGDEAELYDRHHRELIRTVSRHVNAGAALIEDACQHAWLQLLRHQPDRASVFPWLYVVAVHEAYRLSTLERRETHLEALAPDSAWETFIPGSRVTLEDQLEALEALRALAGLPDRQRRDLALFVAGYKYREIAQLTGGRTYTNVNKHLTKARTAIRSADLS
jgi:RNA polymerase sigma factor (sigma-70 family)